MDELGQVDVGGMQVWWAGHMGGRRGGWDAGGRDRGKTWVGHRQDVGGTQARRGWDMGEVGEVGGLCGLCEDT